MAIDPQQKLELLKRKRELLQRRSELVQQKSEVEMKPTLIERGREAIETGLEVGKEQFEKAKTGLETAATAFTRPETFVQAEEDRFVETEEPREVINRIEQFGKGLQEFGAGTIGTVFGPLIGAVIGAAKPEIAPIIQKITQSKTGEELINAFQELPEDVQDSAFNLLETAGIKGAAKIRKGAEIAAKETGEAAGVAAKALEGAAEAQTLASRQDFARDLVMPKQTKKVVEEQIKAGQIEEGGIFAGRTTTPTGSEQRIIDEVAKIESVTPKNTQLQNANIIKGEIARKGDELVSKLEANDFIFPKKELDAFLNRAKENIAQNPTIVGDAEKSAQKILDQFDRIMANKKSTGSELLKARKELDSWIKSQKGTGIFDPKNENALSIALREVRQGVNDFLDEKATNVAVKESLQSQSNLFRAIDNIAPKAAEEASTSVGRALQRVGEITGLRSQVMQTLATLGIAGGGVTLATLAPATIAAAIPIGLIVGGVKTARSVAAKNALSKLLRQLEKAKTNAIGADAEAIDAAISQIIPLVVDQEEKQPELGE